MIPEYPLLTDHTSRMMFASFVGHNQTSSMPISHSPSTEAERGGYAVPIDGECEMDTGELITP
jgi:hypothetical protein